MSSVKEVKKPSEVTKERSFQHDWLNFTLVFVNAGVFILVIFFNVASSSPKLGIFPRTNANISGDNQVEFTPAGWAFSTWVIFCF